MARGPQPTIRDRRLQLGKCQSFQDGSHQGQGCAEKQPVLGESRLVSRPGRGWGLCPGAQPDPAEGMDSKKRMEAPQSRGGVMLGVVVREPSEARGTVSEVLTTEVSLDLREEGSGAPLPGR